MKKLAVVLASSMLLAACGASSENHEGHHSHESSDKVTPVKVKLTVPDHIKVDEKVELSAKVTHDGKNVNDADEVMFEIIRDHNTKTSVKKKVTKATDGIYKLDYTFDKKGKYEVISHVTAHNQHTMPDKQLTVN